MSRKKKLINNSDLPDHEIEAIARCIYPDILELFESEKVKKSLPNGRQERLRRKRKMSSKRFQRKCLQVPSSYVNLALMKMLVIRRCKQMKILGERMKQLREESGFSQNKLAKLVGLPQSSINRYESGFSNPAPETLVWYADYFDVSLDFLFGRTDKPQGKRYQYKPKLDPEMAKFVEMCFEPGTRANKELKASILKMVSEEKK